MHAIFPPGVVEVPTASVRSCELGCVCAVGVVRQASGWIDTATGRKRSERNVGDNRNAWFLLIDFSWKKFCQVIWITGNHLSESEQIF